MRGTDSSWASRALSKATSSSRPLVCREGYLDAALHVEYAATASHDPEPYQDREGVALIDRVPDPQARYGAWDERP